MIMTELYLKKSISCDKKQLKLEWWDIFLVKIINYNDWQKFI